MSNNESTFCPVPWIGLAVRTNGDYRVCCHANTSSSKGLLTESGRILNASIDPISLMRNSDEIKDIRLTMLRGEWHSACVRCKTDETFGLNSRRKNSVDEIRNSFTLEDAKNSTNSDGSINLALTPLMDLDIRLGNICNLKCRTCGPIDSSSWAKDKRVNDLFPNMEDEQKTMYWYERNSFWLELLSQTKELKHVYVVGGEPLLIKEHFEFLRELIKLDVAKNITLEYNTNLTILPSECFEIWPHFRQIRVGVSIDAYGKFNDYIRYPSQFNQIESNILKLKSIPKIRIWISSTISIYSVFSIFDLAEWSYNLLSDLMPNPLLVFKSHALHAPMHLSLRALDSKSKKHIEKYLNDKLNSISSKKLNQDLYRYLTITVEKYINFMNSQDFSEHLPKFLEFTKYLDEESKYSFQNLYPEFYNQLTISE